LFVAASIAAAAGWVAERGWPALRLGAVILTGLLLASTNLRTTLAQYGQIVRNGGTPIWSEAIYSLHDSLQTLNAKKIVVLDWGIGQQLRYLSKDHLPIQEAPQPSGADRFFAETIEKALNIGQAFFVGYEVEGAPVNPLTRQLFDQVLEHGGRTRERVITIADRQGRVIYGVYKTKAAAVGGDSAIPE
jgi:hypothetical protein